MMKYFTKKSIYIGLFAILYLIVAFSSFFHACSFFGLANNSWMSIILAFAFEVGQAAVLFSLLTSQKDRSRIMPWVLMFMFTLVQVIGNVFSSYKYLITNSVENLRYFKEPIFIWTDLPDDQTTVIITYIVGAILPICALFLTSMITNYLTDNEEEQKLNNLQITADKGPENPPIIINNEKDFEDLYKEKKNPIQVVTNSQDYIQDANDELIDNNEHEKVEELHDEPEIENEDNETIVENDEGNDAETSEEVKTLDNEKTDKPSENTSHFVNLN